MFGFSGEHLVILGIILLVFGPRRLPELGNTMGKALRNFKDGLAGVKDADFRKLGDSPDSGPKPGAVAKPASPASAAKPASSDPKDPPEGTA